jgi:SAM-dependent methyltransferase
MASVSGYTTDIGYTHGYYREMTPAMLRLVCLSAGVAPPPAGPLRYLELGFGQGLSLNINACAFDGEFWGTDFNPAHVAHARALADASGSGAILLEDSFAELAGRTDLPEFDIIALHGIWSWISEENRHLVVDTIRRKLRPGGLVYVAYNALTGWAPKLPLQHLMKLHAAFAGAEAKGALAQADEAVAFAKQLADAGAPFFRANPAVTEWLKTMAGQNRSYLVHEYFGEHWTPMAFAEVARSFEAAKLTFVASARLLDHVLALNLTPEAQALLATIQHPVFRESVREYFFNPHLRCDLFVKGARPLAPVEQMEALRAQTFALVRHPADVPMKVTGARGEANLQEQVYRPVVAALAEDPAAPKTLAEITGHPALRSLSFADIVEFIRILVGAGHVEPAQRPTERNEQRCAALNRHLLQRARTTGDIAFLASPVVGGLMVSAAEQLMLLAAAEGRSGKEAHAAFLDEALVAQGRSVSKDGQVLQGEARKAELLAQAAAFAEKRAGILQALRMPGSGG